MTTVSFLNNALVQLFNTLEDKCNVKFATFCENESTTEHNIITKKQKYMQAYEDTFDNKIYKYLYDPNLNFDFRFHQRLARISYEDRSQPWVTIMFNTGPVKSLTNIISSLYTGYVQEEDGSVLSYKTKKVQSHINMVLISNNLTYSYNVTEKIAMYFDRFINFHYLESIRFSKTLTKDWELVGQASNITQVDLNKYDTSARGSIVASAFSFDLNYWVTTVPNESFGLLEKVILHIRTVNSDKDIMLAVTE